jgi:anti-anti-sigma regulatory factor
MPMNTVWLKSDGVGVVPAFEEAIDLDHADGEGEVVLDFSGVERIDPRALGTLEMLAASADGKAVKIVLRNVNVAVYKVLKLMRLESRFSFRT